MSARASIIHRLEAMTREYGVTVAPDVWLDDLDAVEADVRADVAAKVKALRDVVEAQAWLNHRNPADGGTHSDTDWRECRRYNCQRAARVLAATADDSSAEKMQEALG